MVRNCILEPVAQSVGGALADWRLAVDLDPTDIGARYSSAVLLEREDASTRPS
jgi:hypothetical protein